MPLAQGQILNNRYRIVKLLGQGGFGAVYRAWDTSLNRPCALKENLDTSPEAERQFGREASMLANLRHSSLPVVTDHFILPGQGQYLVMDFVEGEDLQSMADRAGGPLPENQVLSWIGQVCDALNYLHSQNPPIIHRDIKPANIRVTPDGRAMLVDFGIAKVYDPKLKTTLGARAVTPGYSPQEQYGTGTTDPRSDVYSLGATLYTLLTGSEPVESIQRNLDVPLPSPRTINPAISPAVERVILRAMEMRPTQRYQSADEMKNGLAGDTGRQPPVSGPPVVAPTPLATQYTTNVPLVAAPPLSAPVPAVHPRKRGVPAWAVALGGIGALLLVGVVGLMLWGGLMLANLGKATVVARPTATYVVAVAVNATNTPVSETVLPADTPPPLPTDTAFPLATDTPRPTDTPVPSRYGGWLDEIVMSVVSSESAVTQLRAGEIDIYGAGLSSGNLPDIQAAGLSHSNQNGLYYELTFNPVGPTFPATGKLNPFSSAKVREAMNWLIDRDYLNQEIYAGGALVKLFPITTQFPDYADLADVVRELEARYGYDLGKAKNVIFDEMYAMGATLGSDNKWRYRNEPVTLIFLIRTDSDGTRRPLGDYVANQLESIGFTVDRQYKKSSEASPLWVGGNPEDGLWHIYTGAWSTTIIDRDQGDNFQFFYSPSSAYGFSQLWQHYTPSQEFDKLCDDLAYNRFANLEERRGAFARALELALEDSARIWLIDGKSFTPYNPYVEVTYDLAAGVNGAQLWPYTLRYVDSEGGLMRWGEPDLLIDPWNPVAGSNWSYDVTPQRATASGGLMADPFTGLFHPLRIEMAEVIVESGLPVGKTLDWVDLKFETQIVVPNDAWADWDASSGRFITAQERFGRTETAKVKSVVYYPSNLYDIVKWHDGSSLSAADFVMGMIMTFDPAKPESAIYDEARVSNLESFMESFKGFRITSTDPLIIEYYTDAYQLDAELNVYTLWPNYGYGEAPWHVIAVANLAEMNGELAYSADKADNRQIEWMSFIGGPSLDILSGYLNQAADINYIPYIETLSQFVGSGETITRYDNLTNWYNDHGHFWVGSGPYYLDRAYLNEKTLTLLHFDDFPDAADRWAGFGRPRIAEVEIDGPGQVALGSEAAFDVYVSFEGAPYPLADIKQVKYLLYNAQGEIVQIGEAEAVEDGHYRIPLSADTTALLSAGACKLEAAVIVLPVSIPTFATFEFVAAQ